MPGPESRPEPAAEGPRSRPESASGNEEDQSSSRPERREEKKRHQRARMAKHGAGVRRVYRDAVLKRARKKGTANEKG